MANWRYYFNRRNEAPQIWSIDEGDQGSETNVLDVKTHRCDTVTHYDPEISSRDPNHPTAWVEVFDAVMRMQQGVAHFFRDPDAWSRKPIVQPTPEQIEEDNARETQFRLDELP